MAGNIITSSAAVGGIPQGDYYYDGADYWIMTPTGLIKITGNVVGTVTTGILMSGTVTTGLSITGAATTGVSISGAKTTGIAITGTTALGIGLGTTGSPLAYTTVTEKAMGVYSTCNTTNASTSFEPVLFETTLTGAGQVGGRVKAYMTTNVALGAWSNALKAEVVYGTSGRTAGLGSAMCAEMTLSAGTTPGTYCLYEGELNLGSGAVTGAETSLMRFGVNGADIATFGTNGYVFSFNGLGTAATGKVFSLNNNASDHALRIKVNGVDYWMLLANASD